MVKSTWKLTTHGNIKTHTKTGVTTKEHHLHSELYELSRIYTCLNVPKIISYDARSQTMVTIKVGTNNVSDAYGEESSKVPQSTFNNVRKVIQLLYDVGVVYPDITGYNFIESGNRKKLWIFDFEHAEVYPKTTNEFVEAFLNGENSWNPDFK